MVDIVRTAGLVRTEESVLRRELENARVIAASATSAVNVFVDIKVFGVDVDVCAGCSERVVSDIRKRGSCQPSDARELYMDLN